MRVSSVTTAVCISLLSAACAVGCWYRAEALRSEAEWLLERSRAQASEYAHSLKDNLATQELETFARRRAVMEKAHVWQRGQTLGIMVAVLAAASAWVLRMWRRLNGELDEATEGLESPQAGEPVSVRASIRPSRT
jgi:hypothetical protein